MPLILLTEEGRTFPVAERDIHTQFGVVRKEQLAKAKAGSVVKSNTGKEFFVVHASFLDAYRRMQRAPQIIPLKDVALIAAETGINRSSKVLDAGSGSGALACFLGNIAKEVVSYEIREDFAAVAMGNVQRLGLKNVSVVVKDIYSGISEKNLDVIVFDLPAPWEALPHAAKALKHGGYLVSYSPTIPQVADFVNALGKEFVHLKTVEVIEREWEVAGRKVRPKSQQIGHSGFLTFCRRA